MVDPATTAWLPGCPLYRMSGLYCPGCGTTRAMHALLHARIVEAAGWNLMLVIALPALVVWGASDIKRWLTGRPLITRRAPAWSIYLLFAAIMLFWILRNIPMAPFNFLAPHAL